jgi:hypothetical protein
MIKLGYEVGSANEVNINLSHLIATGITQLSGKTTTEEALIKRSGKRELNKDFLEDAKNQIATVINGLDDEQKKMLKFCEAIGKGTTVSEIMEKGLLINSKSGGSQQRVKEKLNVMVGLELIRKDTASKIYANLKAKITKHLEIFNATSQEIEAVYNNILMEMLGGS